MTLRRALATAALTSLALAGCAAAPERDTGVSGDGAGPTVVTSTNVYGAVAAAVGGDRVKVTSLIHNSAADPHSYESTPGDAARVADARIVVFNGGGYDPFMPRLVESTGRDPDTIEVTTLAGQQKTSDGGGGEHGGVNEHVWYDLPVMQRLATEIAAHLGAADPAGAAAYTRNAETFSKELDDLIVQVEGIAAANQGARVAVTEPLPGHLIEAAGLTDVTPPEFTEAVEEDTDPPAAAVAQTLALFQTDPVRVLIVNAQTTTPSTDEIRRSAEAAGVPVVEMTETLPEGTTDYVSWMRAQINALATALDRR